MKHCFVLLCLLASGAAQPLNVMPVPATAVQGKGSLAIEQTFRAALTGYTDSRLRAAMDRFREQLTKSTGMPPLPPPQKGQSAGPLILIVQCAQAGKPVQALDENESYKLVVTTKQAHLTAPNPLGVLHGLETFLQLIQPGPNGYFVPAVTIEDKPRFAWRGLMIDVCRHWMPLPVILRQLDAMAAVKLNVFHWHLTDDQGFRIESKLFPKLHKNGSSDNNYFTQAQVKEVVAYARNRGIRVVPEFDMPGHTAAWFPGMPDLASGSGFYKLENTWGVFPATMDPTRESTYEFLDKFIGEMTALFPDEYFHIGGDEVAQKTEWNSSEHVVAFKKEQKLKTNDDLQAYFNKRLQAIVTKHGKHMEGWDEILNPDLPKDILIHSWRGQKSLADGARLGFHGILSAPYYLDHMDPAWMLYLADPLGRDAASLTEEEQARIHGGEVCMWDEYVTSEIIDGRIWPRTAAVAERFWSPEKVTGVDDMYRRLELLSRRLEWLGLQHQTAYRTMLQRLAGPDPVGPLQILADILRPVSLGGRVRARKYTQQTPLNRLVDTVLPESAVARDFTKAVTDLNKPVVRQYLAMWKANDLQVRPTLDRNAILQEIVPVSADVAKLSGIGLQALDYIESGQPAPESWVSEQRTYITGITNNKRPPTEVVILIAEPIGTLVDRAAQR
jgi:hexosaminidase